MKRSQIYIISFFLGVSCLLLPSVQNFFIKYALEYILPYNVEKIDNLKITFHPISISFQNLSLTEKKDLVLKGTDVQIVRKKKLWDIKAQHIGYYSTHKKTLSFDASKFTPAILANTLQKTHRYFANIHKVQIQKLSIDKQEYHLEFNQYKEKLSGIITCGSDSLTVHSTPHLISINGTWQQNPFLLECHLQKEDIQFHGKFHHPNAPKYFGNQLLFKGILKHQYTWCLHEFSLITDKGHKIHGECLSQGSQLKGQFFWKLPLMGPNFTTCKIDVSGSPQNPFIEWVFVEGIAPLENLSGNCKVIDPSHLKITGKAFHDKKNQALFDCDINFNPFQVTGNFTVAAEDLQKIFLKIRPTLKGKAKLSIDMQHVRSFLTGNISIAGDADIYDEGTHLPINLSINLHDSQGQGAVLINKGKLQKNPLALTLHFKSNSTSIEIADFSVIWADIHCLLEKPLSYLFTEGLSSPALLKTLGGQIVINNLLVGFPFEQSTFSINVKNINLEPFHVFFEHDKILGNINAEIIKTKENPLKATFNLQQGYWQKTQYHQPYKLIESLNTKCHIIFDRSFLQWNIVAKDKYNLDLQSNGKLDVEKRTIDTAIKGLVRLKLLTDYLATGDRIYGDVSVNIRLFGDVYSPDFSGSINADNGLYEHNEVGTFYQNITIKTQAKGKRFFIKQFTAQDIRNSKNSDFGQLHGEGWFDFSDISAPEVYLPLHLTHLRIAQSDGFISDASGTLNITGKGSNIGCKGEITLEKASFFIDQGTEEKVPTLTDQKMEKEEKFQASQATAFPLDILVHTPEDTFKVIGMGADTLWKGDFYVKKSIINPCIIGTVFLQKGTLDVLGKVLNLTFGEITFIETDRNNPQLNIVATKRIDERQKVSLAIKGSGTNTNINFTATPQLQTEEILALLLFGKHLSDISVLQSIQLASVAKGEHDHKKDFFTQLRSSLGFDEFEFKMTTHGGASTTDTDATPQERAEAKKSQAVHIGKEFGNIRVAIEQGAGTDTSKLVVSTPLSNNLALQGDVGGSQNSGVGVNWVKRY